MCCTWLRPGHLSIHVGDCSQRSEEIVTNLKLQVWMQLLLLFCHKGKPLSMGACSIETAAVLWKNHTDFTSKFMWFTWSYSPPEMKCECLHYVCHSAPALEMHLGLCSTLGSFDVDQTVYKQMNILSGLLCSHLLYVIKHSKDSGCFMPLYNRCEPHYLMGLWLLCLLGSLSLSLSFLGFPSLTSFLSLSSLSVSSCISHSTSSSVFPAISAVCHLGEIFVYVTIFFHPTIEVVTFHLHEWRMLGVFLLPAFTHLGHECQDLLNPCDAKQVCTD